MNLGNCAQISSPLIPLLGWHQRHDHDSASLIYLDKESDSLVRHGVALWIASMWMYVLKLPNRNHKSILVCAGSGEL